VGRYLGFDPVGGSAKQPQSWNRLSYVLGNPLKYIDPMGLTPHPDCPLPCDSIEVIGQEPKKKDRPLPDFVALIGFFIEASTERGSLSTGFGMLDVSTAQRFYQTGFEQAAGDGKNLQAAFYFGVNELFVPESQGELGIELAMAVIPGNLDNLGYGAIKGARFTPDQEALVALGKEARRRGVTLPEARILKEWARELGIPFRGPEAHPTRSFGRKLHIHLGPINHILVRR
jgi:hypothetical protein